MVYAPGRDGAPTSQDGSVAYNPRRAQGAAGGVFAKFLQGATPKYAVNAGLREVQMRDTMARMFIRVDRDEYNSVFLGSIGDPVVRDQLAPRIAGDPTNPRLRGQQVVDTGYLDFLLQNAQHQFQEKYQVSETLSDNYVAYMFGQSPPVWNYSGLLINSVQDDQVSHMVRLYLHLLRGTQLARRQKTVSLRYDSFVVAGSIVNFTWNLQAQNELLVPFSFQLLVKRVFITNYTSGWVPTQPGSVFAADPNAVAYDGRPVADRPVRAMVVRQPVGTEEGPVPQAQADARTSAAPPVPASSTDASLVSQAPAPGARLSGMAEAAAAQFSSNPDVRDGRPDPTGPPLADGSFSTGGTVSVPDA